MATPTLTKPDLKIDYPTSDGKPMAETDLHRDLIFDLIDALKIRFQADPSVYVSGNLLLYYVEGDKHKHISPDVFVVRGVAKGRRDCYFLWEEGRGPEVVFEITSKSTKDEDGSKKWMLDRDVLRVPEYFQFDPTEDYLRPSLQGHRLVGGEYVPIEPVEGRLPSETLGLLLQRVGTELRLVDPETGRRLPTSREQAAEALALADDALTENDRLRRELEDLRRRLANGH